MKGAFIRDAVVWFCSPRVRNAIVGAVSSFVVRNARDGASHSWPQKEMYWGCNRVQGFTMYRIVKPHLLTVVHPLSSSSAS